MSKESSTNNLSPFEAQLAGLSPRQALLDRDEIMYRVGYSAARRELAWQPSRHRTRGLQAVCGVLMCVVVSQWAAMAMKQKGGAADLRATTQAEPSPVAARIRGSDVPARGEKPGSGTASNSPQARTEAVGNTNDAKEQLDLVVDQPAVGQPIVEREDNRFSGRQVALNDAPIYVTGLKLTAGSSPDQLQYESIISTRRRSRQPNEQPLTPRSMLQGGYLR